MSLDDPQRLKSDRSSGECRATVPNSVGGGRQRPFVQSTSSSSLTLFSTHQNSPSQAPPFFLSSLKATKMIKRVIVSTLLVGCVALGESGMDRRKGRGEEKRREEEGTRCRPKKSVAASKNFFSFIVSAFFFFFFLSLHHLHLNFFLSTSTSTPQNLSFLTTAAAQGDTSAAAAAANKSKGADALDAMLSTSKGSASGTKGDVKSAGNATATAAAPAPAPSSPSAPSPPAPAKSNTGGSSAAGCSTPLQWLQNSGSYKKFLQLIDATPAAARLADILDSPDVALTLLAPTDDAITDSLTKQGLSFSDLVVRRGEGFAFCFDEKRWIFWERNKSSSALTSLLSSSLFFHLSLLLFSLFFSFSQANPALSLMVLQFHMLPNPIPTDQLVNGYSFNTVSEKRYGCFLIMFGKFFETFDFFLFEIFPLFSLFSHPPSLSLFFSSPTTSHPLFNSSSPETTSRTPSPSPKEARTRSSSRDPTTPPRCSTTGPRPASPLSTRQTPFYFRRGRSPVEPLLLPLVVLLPTPGLSVLSCLLPVTSPPEVTPPLPRLLAARGPPTLLLPPPPLPPPLLLRALPRREPAAPPPGGIREAPRPTPTRPSSSTRPLPARKKQERECERELEL